MIRKLISYSRARVLCALSLLLISGFLVPQFAFPHAASADVIASDNFNRADGGLGANWTATCDGGMAIASQQVTGTAGAVTGDIVDG